MFYCCLFAIFVIMGKVITTDTTVNKDIGLRVRITPYLDNELTRIAESYECTRSDLVRVVLINFVETIGQADGKEQGG